MSCIGYEQGPIRPPSEARSLLVRVSRNCPWNYCAFCPVYKGTKFSLRPVDEVLSDIAAMKQRYGDAPRTAFLQDANPLLTKVDDLVRILEVLRSTFPELQRVTAYARSHTLARRTPAELERIRHAGLDRLHVGMESGCDSVLKLVSKGSSRDEQIRGDLPQELDRLIAVCDRFLELPETERQRFIRARRLHLVSRLDERRMRDVQADVDRILELLDARGQSPDQLFQELRERMV